MSPAAVNVPLPSSYTGWTLNARHIPNLDMCTHDVSVTAAKGAQERVSNTASGAPGGTVSEMVCGWGSVLCVLEAPGMRRRITPE